MAEVDYYFTLLSPWAYIGHDAFHQAMERTGTTVNYRPINLPQAFEASDTPMLGNRHKTRQDYRTLELQRWGVKRGLSFNYWPAHWPFPAANADKMVISLVQNGESPAAFMREVFTGIWERETNFADESALVSAADAVGHNGATLLEQAKQGEIEKIYARSTKDAIEMGVFGVPAYFYDGEYFWGQDRIELLEDALKSGRPGFKCVYPG
ncbi:MAG: 2-hydroxychromene-2-carboxylate isomerase [Rhizobiales bacterium]|nr:2-hydroxychromene-2-carboxylate isomerase [Hyphomicrobiales bacterium]